MDKKTIRALEPKYTGNTRHLSEGEAAAIMADMERNGQDDVTDGSIPIPVIDYTTDDNQ